MTYEQASGWVTAAPAVFQVGTVKQAIADGLFCPAAANIENIDPCPDRIRTAFCVTGANSAAVVPPQEPVRRAAKRKTLDDMEVAEATGYAAGEAWSSFPCFSFSGSTRGCRHRSLHPNSAQSALMTTPAVIALLSCLGWQHLKESDDTGCVLCSLATNFWGRAV
ncbi:MAG: hypothetical protein ACJ8AW_44900 [Rhodopila sp.]